MVVQEQLQGSWLQQVACMMQLCNLGNRPHLVAADLLQTPLVLTLTVVAVSHAPGGLQTGTQTQKLCCLVDMRLPRVLWP